MNKSDYNCPVCGSHPGRDIYRFRDKMFFTVSECSDLTCGHLFLNPPLDEGASEQLEDEHMRKEYSPPSEEELDGKVDEFNYITDYLARWNKRPVSVLEIGVGYGYGLVALKRAGHHVTGVDISKERIACAKRISGVEVHRNISDIPADLIFDAVVMWHVLEHVIEPVEMLKSLRGYLIDGSRLYIQVPSGDRIEHFTNTSKRGMFCRTHTNYFTKRAMTKLLWKCGYWIEDVCIDEKNFFLTVVAVRDEKLRLALNGQTPLD